MFYGVFIAKEVDGVGDKELGGTIKFDAHTLLEAFVNMLLKSASFICKALLW